jgi:hypothetical protein
MATKYISGTTNSILVGDKGTNGATPTPTKVGAELCSAALELQSTTRGFLPPRMTTAQIAAIAYPVNGMRAYDTTLQADVIYVNGAWVTQNTGPTGDLYASGTIVTADLLTMYTTGLILIAAPGANKSIVVKNFWFELNSDGANAFTGGGVIGLQYTTAGHAGLAVTGTIPAAFLTGAATDRATMVAGSFLAAATADYVNTPVCITNATAVFADGGTSTANWKIWYSIVPTI